MSSSGKHEPWHFRFLVASWTLQFLFLALETVLYIIILDVIDHNRDLYSNVALAVGIVQFILALASFGLTIAECVQLFRHRLSPLFFLISNLIKTAIWIALVVTSAVLKSEGQTEETVPYPGDDGMFTYTYKAYRYATTTVILTFVLLIIFVIPLAYAAFIFHKNKRNWGAYNGILRREPEAGVPLGMMRDSCSPDDMIRSDFYAPREDTGEPKAEFMELQSKEPYEGSTSYKE